MRACDEWHSPQLVFADCAIIEVDLVPYGRPIVRERYSREENSRRQSGKERRRTTHLHPHTDNERERESQSAAAAAASAAAGADLG